jgi:hypothetical protein
MGLKAVRCRERILALREYRRVPLRRKGSAGRLAEDGRSKKVDHIDDEGIKQ